MANTLPKQAFVALAAVGWADGSLKRSEAAALVEAAKKHGLEGDDLAEVERSTKSSVALAAFEPGEMSTWDRVVTYALASWMARLDGVQSTSETETLKLLGERLGLDNPVRDRAASAAFDIAVLPEGGRPDKYDFGKLVDRLREKLPKHAAS
jgi:uncharacterized membrane protein YebE (DUF533 family)